jgi:hypothetical protein
VGKNQRSRFAGACIQKVKTGHGKPELFERYRTVAESLASDLYDQGAFRAWPDGRIAESWPYGGHPRHPLPVL